MKTACAFVALLCLIPLQQLRGAQNPRGVPIIRLEKSRFALGEAVFFWVGVKMTGRLPIPKEYQSTCRLTITRPDSTQKTQPVSWPVDGPPNSGWLGGHGLEEDKPQLGRYTLVFEFAGQKTSQYSFVIEEVPVIKEITAEFVFDPAESLLIPPGGSATLTIHNGSAQTLRFPHRDGINALVSVTITKGDGSYSNSLFYPADKLLDQDVPEMPELGFDTFTWKSATQVSTITLRPGETYKQELSLASAFAEAGKNLPIPPGQYSVSFFTTLQVLIGERGGQWKDFSPVRMPVVSTTTCIVTP